MQRMPVAEVDSIARPRFCCRFAAGESSVDG